MIFDFDGVIVDSEVLSNTILAEALTDLGHPTTFEQAVQRVAERLRVSPYPPLR